MSVASAGHHNIRHLIRPPAHLSAGDWSFWSDSSGFTGVVCKAARGRAAVRIIGTDNAGSYKADEANARAASASKHMIYAMIDLVDRLEGIEGMLPETHPALVALRLAGCQTLIHCTTCAGTPLPAP